MIKRELTVRCKEGLQSKSAALFIQKASGFKSDIWIEKGERKANAKSLLGLLSLSIGCGSNITITAEGEDEIEAIAELGNYLENEMLN